jgi:hypothetical protein
VFVAVVAHAGEIIAAVKMTRRMRLKAERYLGDDVRIDYLGATTIHSLLFGGSGPW